MPSLAISNMSNVSHAAHSMQSRLDHLPLASHRSLRKVNCFTTFEIARPLANHSIISFPHQSSNLMAPYINLELSHSSSVRAIRRTIHRVV